MSERCRRKECDICIELSLSLSQFACILSFPEEEDIGVARMATRLGLSPSRASRIVDSLVRRGMMTRAASDRDRRRETLRLTRKGLGKRRSINAALDDCERRLQRALGGRRKREIEQALARLVDAF